MDNPLLNKFNKVITMENKEDNIEKKIKIDIYNPVLCIDCSYYIFYRFFALCSWWKRAFPEDPLDIENILENKIFIDKFYKLFFENIKKIIKKYKLKNANIIFAKDCRRYNIWRNEHYSDYKKTRDDKNKRFNKDIFIYTYDHIVPDFEKHGINIISIENAEADDIIAIVKKKIRKENTDLPIYIITNDHDYLQLFDDNTYIYNLKGLNLRTKSRGNAKEDLQFKIFRGDMSDNITPVVSKKYRDDKLINLIYNKEQFDQFFEKNPDLKTIYDRNELLIDFNKIPEKIKNDITNFIEFI